MAHDPDKPIDFDPDDQPSPDDSGLSIEPVNGDDADLEPDHASIKALDVCPHCGSTLPDVNTLVCLRCGWDFKANRRIKVAVKKDSAQAVDDDDEPIGPMSPPGLGDHWLPAAVALSSVLLLAVGYLAGADSLVPGTVTTEGAPPEPAPITTRLVALIKFIMQLTLLAGCGVGALYALARTASRPLGDLQLAVIRIAAVMAAVSLVRFINLPSNNWEFMVELLLQAAAFIGLSLLLFRLALREALSLLGLLVLAMLALLVAAGAVGWVLTP